MRSNAELNRQKLKSTPEVLELDWERCTSCGLSAEQQGLVRDADLILAAGVCLVISAQQNVYFLHAAQTRAHITALTCSYSVDVVYDGSVIPSLVQTISTLLQLASSPTAYCLVSSTIRNPETYSNFKTQLGKPETYSKLKLTCNQCHWYHWEVLFLGVRVSVLGVSGIRYGWVLGYRVSYNLQLQTTSDFSWVSPFVVTPSCLFSHIICSVNGSHFYLNFLYTHCK